MVFCAAYGIKMQLFSVKRFHTIVPMQRVDVTVYIDGSYAEHGRDANVLHEWHDRIPQNDPGLVCQLRTGTQHHCYLLDGPVSNGHSLELVGHRLGQGSVQ